MSAVFSGVYAVFSIDAFGLSRRLFLITALTRVLVRVRRHNIGVVGGNRSSEPNDILPKVITIFPHLSLAFLGN